MTEQEDKYHHIQRGVKTLSYKRQEKEEALDFLRKTREDIEEQKQNIEYKNNNRKHETKYMFSFKGGFQPLPEDHKNVDPEDYLHPPEDEIETKGGTKKSDMRTCGNGCGMF